MNSTGVLVGLERARMMLSCIVGPTAAGKSAVAMQLAQQCGLAIVSADSRQIYRGFDVGTAKPTTAERAHVPHYGIDVADPSERYSAHRWAESAKNWMQKADASGRAPLIVGGTGLYVRALVEPLDGVPTLDAEQRAALAPILDTLPMPELERWCARLDPPRALLGRTQRLRAIETALLTGRRLSDSLRNADSDLTRTTSCQVRYLVVDPGPVLATRIEQRVHDMLQSGWEEEISRLMKTTADDAPAWKASGYAVLRDAMEGRMSRAAAVERVVIETRQYAKRQRTWFRHQLPASHVTRLNPLEPDAMQQAVRWWQSVSTEGVSAA
jgi:tRNA dimethylallyltransferase